MDTSKIEVFETKMKKSLDALNNEYATTIVIKDDTNILTPTVQLNIA